MLVDQFFTQALQSTPCLLLSIGRPGFRTAHRRLMCAFKRNDLLVVRRAYWRRYWSRLLRVCFHLRDLRLKLGDPGGCGCVRCCCGVLCHEIFHPLALTLSLCAHSVQLCKLLSEFLLRLEKCALRAFRLVF